MRLYDERNKTPNMTCGYCHESGHRRNHCPTLKAHYEQDQRGEPVDPSLLTQLTKYWGVQSSQVQNWYERYGKADAERYFGEKTAKAKPKKRKKAKCGFCGKTSHNRRNCKAMKQFKYLYEQANLAYRKEFYDRIIVGMGYGSGALVSMRLYEGQDTSPIALVSDLDPMSIGLGNLIGGYWSEYATTLRTSVLWRVKRESYNGTLDCFISKTHNPQVCERMMPSPRPFLRGVVPTIGRKGGFNPSSAPHLKQCPRTGSMVSQNRLTM